MSCDLTICADSAVFGQTGLRVGRYVLVPFSCPFFPPSLPSYDATLTFSPPSLPPSLLSFDAGYGSGHKARLRGQKEARIAPSPSLPPSLPSSLVLTPATAAVTWHVWWGRKRPGRSGFCVDFTRRERRWRWG